MFESVWTIITLATIIIRSGNLNTLLSHDSSPGTD